MMIWRLWMHMRSRIAEERAKRDLAMAAKFLKRHVFFCHEKDKFVLALRAKPE